MSASGDFETAVTRAAVDVPINCRPLVAGDPAFIGPYRLLGRLGAGGMGVVYLGEHSTGMRAAIKVVRPELAALPQFRDRFAREMGIASAVRGRFTAAVVGSDLHAEQPWVASEYVPGPTLADHIETHGLLSEAEAVQLAVGLADALAAIHAVGAVHRDLKPSNIILAADGPKVIDFGIAHAMEATSLTQTGAYLGTLAWSSPEQITGQSVGPASDVFAWGLVVAYASTGGHPYGQGRSEAMAYRIINQKPDLAGIPPALTPAVDSALRTPQKDRGDLHLLRRSLHVDSRGRSVQTSATVNSGSPSRLRSSRTAAEPGGGGNAAAGPMEQELQRLAEHLGIPRAQDGPIHIPADTAAMRGDARPSWGVSAHKTTAIATLGLSTVPLLVTIPAAIRSDQPELILAGLVVAAIVLLWLPVWLAVKLLPRRSRARKALASANSVALTVTAGGLVASHASRQEADFSWRRVGVSWSQIAQLGVLDVRESILGHPSRVYVNLGSPHSPDNAIFEYVRADPEVLVRGLRRCHQASLSSEDQSG